MSKPEIFTRAAPVSGTADPDARTVQVTFATSTPVKRYSWDDGYYLEVLEISRDAIDASRMNEGMSLLDTHDQHSMDSRLGSVVPGSFKIVNGEAVATVKFSRRERADQYFQDILDGHKTPISVGYKVLETRRTEGQGDALPTVTATRWLPTEISVVPVPADANASTRSEGIDPMPDPIENNEQRHQRPAPTNIINERRRVSDLRYLARSANIEDTELDRAIEEGTTVDAFRNYVFDKMVERQNESPTFPVVATQGMEAGMSRADAMISALMARVNPAHKVEGEARQFVGLPVAEIARRCLEARSE